MEVGLRLGPMRLIDGVRLLCSPGSTRVAADVFLGRIHWHIRRKGALIGRPGDDDSVAQGVVLNKDAVVVVVDAGASRHLVRP